MKYIAILLLSIFSIALIAQSGQMLSTDENDPKAARILDKLSADFESFKSMEVDFNLTIQLPEQPEEVQKGKIIQQGENYVLHIDNQSIYSNGEAIWLHLKRNNEVQINDPDMGEETDMLSPKDMLRIYESGDFAYFLTESPMVEGKRMNKIEFKPLDSDSEYFKISLLVEKSANKMVEMKVFSKDGSRYILKINNIVPNKDYDPAIFAFDESKFPGIYIEDLRID